MRTLFCLLVIAGYSSVSAAEPRVIASLERYGCEGDCVAYKVTVFQDGTVEFRGTIGMKKKGLQTAKLSSAEIAELRAAFAAADFFDLPAQLSCAIDAPSARTLFADGKRTATRYHDSYCDTGARTAKQRAHAKTLTTLERAIDRIANTSRWLNRRP